MTDVLSRFHRASAQGHDKPLLEAEQSQRIIELYERFPREASTSPRLLKLSKQPAAIKSMDADALVSAAADVIGWQGHELSPQLVALTFVVARLGGISAAFRIGLLAMAELQSRTAMPRGRLS